MLPRRFIEQQCSLCCTRTPWMYCTWRCLDRRLKAITAAKRLRSWAYVHAAVQSDSADMIASSTWDSSWRWRQIKKVRRNKATSIQRNMRYSVIINSPTHLICRKNWCKLNRVVADFGSKFLGSVKWDREDCCAGCEQVIWCRWEYSSIHGWHGRRG